MVHEMEVHAVKQSKAKTGNRRIEGWCFNLERGEMVSRVGGRRLQPSHFTLITVSPPIM